MRTIETGKKFSLTNWGGDPGSTYIAPNWAQPQNRTLPTDGILPSDTEYRYSPIVRVAKLKAFRDERALRRRHVAAMVRFQHEQQRRRSSS